MNTLDWFTLIVIASTVGVFLIGLGSGYYLYRSINRVPVITRKHGSLTQHEIELLAQGGAIELADDETRLRPPVTGASGGVKLKTPQQRRLEKNVEHQTLKKILE